MLGHDEVDVAQHELGAEALADPAQLEQRLGRGHAEPPAFCARDRPDERPVGDAGQRDRHDEEEDRGHDVRRVVEGLGALDLRLAQRLDDAEDRDEADVLEQRHEVVEQRRDHPPDALRQHHVAHGLRRGQAEGARRRPLARVHREDAGPDHLGDVRGVGDHDGGRTEDGDVGTGDVRRG